MKKKIEYHDGDALLEGYLSLDDTADAAKPLVLVAHAWAGRSEFENAAADRLASLGYAGFALDNYGKGKLGSSAEENTALMTPFIQDRALLQKRLLAGLEAARNLEGIDASRVAAIGFCFGGMCVLDLARSGADLRGVVSFHGLFSPSGLEKEPIRASVLALHGYDDPMAQPAEMTRLASELGEAGADWQIHAYGNTVHAFTNPQANMPDAGMQYSEKAANRAWQSMASFLAEVLA